MTVQELITKLGFDVDESEAKKYEAGLKKIENVARGVTVGVLGIGAASLKFFATQEKAELSLRASLEASGQEVDKNLESMKKYASELQGVTTVGDEASLELMQMATNMGLNSEQAKQATKDAIGMSKAFKVDVKTAIKATSMAVQGDTTMLNRYIPTLRGVKDDAERVAIAQQALAKSFEVAKADALSFSGQIESNKNKMGDFLEGLGKIVAIGFIPLLTKVSELTSLLASLDAETLQNIVTVGLFAAGIYPLIKIIKGVMAVKAAYIALIKSEIIVSTIATAKLYAMAVATKVMTAAQWLLNAATTAWPIMLIIAGIIALIAAGVWLYKNWDLVKEKAAQLWEVVKAGLKTVIDLFMQWKDVIVLLLGPFGVLINIITALVSRWGEVTEAFKSGGILGAIKKIGSIIFSAILSPIQKVLGLIAKIPGIGKFAEQANTALSGFQANIDPAGAGVPQSVINNNQGGGGTTNINSNISVGVPAGSSAEQSKFIQQDVRKVVREENERVARRTKRGSRRVE